MRRMNCISIETAQSSLDCSVLAKLPGKNIILGVLDLSTNEVETPENVAARIRRALPYISADRLVIAPDCGMKYLPRDVAFGKLKAMVAGAGHGPRGIRRSPACLSNRLIRPRSGTRSMCTYIGPTPSVPTRNHVKRPPRFTV